MNHPLSAMTDALYSAIHVDLPEIEHEYGNVKNRRTRVGRPSIYNVWITQFVQTWSSTNLGFGGMGGQSFTSAYTTIVSLYGYGIDAVYFDGKFAYLIRGNDAEYRKDVLNQQVSSVLLASINYKGFRKDKDYKQTD